MRRGYGKCEGKVREREVSGEAEGEDGGRGHLKAIKQG